MAASKITPDTPVSDSKICITVTDKGPYLVYGRPPLAMQYIMPNAVGDSWFFQEGRKFSTEAEPTALCRCGASHNKPYCDGAHVGAQWNPQLTASDERLFDQVEITEGPSLTVTDNPKYCVFARFCHPYGGVWRLTETSKDPQSRKIAVREASLCPSERLTAWDNRTGKPYEFHFEPSMGLIQDPVLAVSGGLWVRGGIAVKREDGTVYEVRNRVVLCRCGQSRNKPYCDGTHASAKWNDDLEGTPEGKTVPEKA